ncbi:MAG: hypothetical protein LQ350_003874 [Teloschistes chrysophthalmus]|nr:MAG: hypothetical protein LQ350_003874 [Niorma chrysophthalma]
MHCALAPGAGLDGLNRVMIQNVAGSLEGLRPIEGQPTRIGLAKWSRREITLATTNAVYGEHNPFKDSTVKQAFCAIFNRSEQLPGTKYKIPLADIAHHEIGGTLAIIVNTAPATFWLLFYIFSHPEVLEDCRREVGKIIRDSTEEGHPKRTLDITGTKRNYPTLTSTYQEVLRQRTLGTEVRQVMRDTILDDTYLLKKGATVIIPSLVMHTDPAVWGPDALEFNHKRFTSKAGSSSSSQQQKEAVKRPSAKAYRVYGGGSTLCPGPHFATTEILATVVMFIMRYDLSPVEGRWVAPRTEKTNISAVVMEPDMDVQVEVTPKQGFADGRWEFCAGGGFKDGV